MQRRKKKGMKNKENNKETKEDRESQFSDTQTQTRTPSK